MNKIRLNSFLVFMIITMLGTTQYTFADNHSEETYSFLKEIGATDEEIERQEHLVTYREHSLIKDNFAFLRDIGSSNSDIIRQLHLLGRTPANIEDNFDFLKEIGSSNSDIIRQLHLLGRTPANIEDNFDFLKEIGASNSDIVRHLHLLGRTPAHLEENYDLLKDFEASDSEIAKQVYLLGRNPEKLQDRYGEPQERTIQSMIDKADEGDTVVVPEGTYTENVVIDKPIELIGESTIIEGRIEINDDATVSGFTFESDSGNLMQINTGDATISNNVFLANGNNAIDIVERFNDLFFINDNEFYGYDNAITLRGDSIFEVMDNRFGEGNVEVLIYPSLQTLNEKSTKDDMVDSLMEENENVFDDEPLNVVVEDP